MKIIEIYTEEIIPEICTANIFGVQRAAAQFICVGVIDDHI